jgi:hypothetical protein
MSNTETPPPDDAVAPSAAPPRPALGVVLGWHIFATLAHAILFTNILWLIPMLVRLRFGAANVDTRDWQTTLITAAVPTLLIFSIFWGEFLRRVRLRNYVLLFWLFGVFPFGCIGLVQSYWQLLLLHCISSFGFAGWVPLNGKLLKHFYPDAARGRIFSVLSTVSYAGGALSAYWIGEWIESRPEAFRLFFPTAALFMVVGLSVLLMLARRTGAGTEREDASPRSWRTLLQPVLHMGSVLRADRTFFRYEMAFMTYGAAFMVCDALLPVLATDRLNMRYEDYAHSTQMVRSLTRLALTMPMGWVMDRVGPMRTSAIAFAVLGLYPITLLMAGSTVGLSVASAIFGLGLAGVMMGWMLGPIALAGSPEKVPQYSAIHATFVGIRGILFQGIGMGLYKITGSFTLPLVLAAAAFVWAAWQMVALHRVRARECAAQP